MVEHQELFWSLFSVDMQVTLKVQPADSWDSFQLFQLLNEYLRNDSEFETPPTTSVATFLNTITKHVDLSKL